MTSAYDWISNLFTDSSTAKAIIQRTGLGKIRHLACSDLWIQERLKSHDFSLEKIDGAKNPADMLTKYVDKPTLQRLIPLASMDWLEGRPEIAPALTHALVPHMHLGHGMYNPATLFR